MKSLSFINEPPSSLEVMVLTFQRNENRFINLVLKPKQQKGIQLP